MILKSLSVGGYKNLRYTTLSFNAKAIAIISPNNYGKSNLLEAFRFATDFISSGAKQRTTMMAWSNGIPLTPTLAHEPFRFDIEFEIPELNEYRYVHYGFSFCWYRDDETGQRILDEWLEMRPTESVKYSSYLKRQSGQYRKGKSTNAFRKIVLENATLAIDILPSIDDLEYSSVLQHIHQFEYRVCDTLDVQNQFQFTPFRIADEDDIHIRFDDEDVPRALYQLKELYPEQYFLFEDAIYSLFPNFTKISVQAHELSPKTMGQNFKVTVVGPSEEGKLIAEDPDGVPFHLKDKVYRVIITSSYLNQPVNLASMSTGTKRIFWLLTNIFIASCTGVSCVGVEELETSIHPRMLKELLDIISTAANHTCIIISSHSPYLVQYLKPENLYTGVFSVEGVAQFFKIQEKKSKKLLNAARLYDLSVGEYLFELMSSGSASMSTLQKYLEGFDGSK